MDPGRGQGIHLSLVLLALYDLPLSGSGIFFRAKEALWRLQARGLTQLMACVDDMREPHGRRCPQLSDKGLLNLKDLLEGGQLLAFAPCPETDGNGNVHIGVPFSGIERHEASLQLHLDLSVLVSVQQVQDVAPERTEKSLCVYSGN